MASVSVACNDASAKGHATSKAINGKTYRWKKANERWKRRTSDSRLVQEVTPLVRIGGLAASIWRGNNAWATCPLWSSKFVR